jgi:DNA-binding FadR family transcriptional regulator
MMLTKLSRQTLTEQAVVGLMEFIQSNNLKPGDMLPSEAQLADSFGVSRPVIREALKSLAGRQVIQIINGKGAMIRPIDSDPLRGYFQKAIQFEPEALIELLEVRKGIEVQSARLAAERRSIEELVQLEQAVVGMREALDDPEQCIALDLEFHLTIASCAHNAMLFYLLKSIREATKSTILEGRSRKTRKELERVQVIHETIYQAIAEGRADQAASTMETHFDEAVLAVAHKLLNQ